ncbi:MAG TPA: HAD family hydrolase [Victivallales bacterium]|nr:HAD family hydrolase [Victivallales bacterium]
MKKLIFDLDGTLIDTVYNHTMSWKMAFNECGWNVDTWKIHRKIGMASRLFVEILAEDIGFKASEEEISHLKQRHTELFEEYFSYRKPLNGALNIFKYLNNNNISYGIATSGTKPLINKSLDSLQLSDGIPLVCGDEVVNTKPAPDLFLRCMEKMSVLPDDCYVVGDSTWDIIAAHNAGISKPIGLLTGGTGSKELHDAGAYKVYKDLVQLEKSLPELGL